MTIKRTTKGIGNTRLFMILGVVAVVLAGLFVALSLTISGGGSQEDLAGIPQNGTTLGREDAPVTISLYEDFQCPACGQFSRDTLPEVVDRLVKPGDAKIDAQTLAFLGEDSVPAARAALAAGEQDRYWQYSHLLFENQGAENSGYVADEFLTDLAEQTEGLDVGRWDQTRDDASIEEKLQAATDAAGNSGVNSTPTLVISGPGGEQVLRGAVPVEDVEQAVQQVRG